MSEKFQSQNQAAWEKLFLRYRILEHVNEEGRFFISASQIKEYREPRLMAKFDHQVNLPDIFSKNNLAILPVSRGDYVISHFKAYQPFESLTDQVCQVRLPSHLQSLDATSIPSETIAINCALASGMLSDFLGEEQLYSTVSGRMGSGCFSFSIDASPSGGRAPRSPVLVEVNNSQIEIDAAFEGEKSLTLIEAKRDISQDFLIRQLYYPFRVWSRQIDKKVRPVFLVYSNGIFSLYEYEFTQPDRYNSLRLIRHKNYSIENTRITLAELSDLWQNTQVQPEPEISFPQANSFERIINLCELLSLQTLTREQVTLTYDFNIRQTNYYTDAARYLGLLEKFYDEGRRPSYRLTPEGLRILSLPYRNRQLALCERIFMHEVFHQAFGACLRQETVPEPQALTKIMKDCSLYRVESESTYVRRASTVARWLHWILGLLRKGG